MKRIMIFSLALFVVSSVSCSEDALLQSTIFDEDTEVSFVTQPTVITVQIISITLGSVVIQGNATNDGGAPIVARGMVWSTAQNPTTTSNTGITNDGSGTGSFTSTISGLSPSTTYYIRAYAINSVGTVYGSQVQFTTTADSTDVRDNTTTVVDVTNPATGRVWMDRNLGASRVATSSTDTQAYGDLYQWGRGADGHEKRNSPTTSTLSSTDQPSHGSFILASDWRSPQNNNLWLGVNGVNNPCPTGYRIPTEAEWNAERACSSMLARTATIGRVQFPVALQDTCTSLAAMPVCSASIARTLPPCAALRIKDTLIYLTLPTLSLSVPKLLKLYT
jgi:uncharacterized protein (TIGR02145 family)